MLLGRSPDVPLPDVIVAVVDALHLERNLFLVTQLLELGRPMVVALNHMDEAATEGIRFDIPELIHELGVTVIPIAALKKEGIDHLRRAIALAPSLPPSSARVPGAACCANCACGNGSAAHPATHRAGLPTAMVEKDEAERRYAWIGDVIARTVRQEGPQRRSISDRVDEVLLHPWAGPLVFLVLMGIVFQAVFSWATPAQDGLESALASLGALVASILPEGDFQSLIVDGLIAGVGSVLVFVPQIAILFFFIGLLEDTGYMARAGLLADRVMRPVGLQGRSFIPMLSGCACGVPAILSTRTIESKCDRMTTIMVIPLMACSARLPVYTLLIGAFVPAVPLLGGAFDTQGVALLAMYLLGTLAALVAAFAFRKTLLKGASQPMIIELPPYRLPNPRNLVMNVAQQATLFLKTAGTVILVATVVFWALATYPKTDIAPGTSAAVAEEVQLENSALGRFGRFIEPTVEPLGFDWKIGVSIMTSFVARETFVASMGTIYGVGSGATEESADLRARLTNERDASGAPRYTILTALSLMVFYAFALMCLSEAAVAAREMGGGRVGWGWVGIQFGYMLAMAYGGAWLVYVAGRAMGLG